MQLVEFPSLARHLADQPLRLRPETATYGGLLVGRKKMVFRFFEDRAQIANRLADAALIEQPASVGEFFERGAVGGHEDVSAGVIRIVPHGCGKTGLRHRPPADECLPQDIGRHPQ